MKIVINISGWDPARQKEIVNSIRGFVKSLAKRFGFQAEFEYIYERFLPSLHCLSSPPTTSTLTHKR